MIKSSGYVVDSLEAAVWSLINSYSYVDREISIGDYILTGGELPAQVMVDSIARLLPGVLKEGSAREESFENGLMEYITALRTGSHNAEREG